ncbi:MAG: HIRAN domain-containing protein [Nitrospira sp.]|nr:HIRAN domain-containing protein [Nitrospira sp.]
MKTLFMAWGLHRSGVSIGSGSAHWFPIGRLDGQREGSWFRFAYTRGVLAAQAKVGFQPLAAFPRLDQVYELEELFPLFRNRVISPMREDYAEYLDRLCLSADQADPFDILAISGGGKQTDNLEVFPELQTRLDGTFFCRFFLHGWDHLNVMSQDRLQHLEPGEALQVSVELNHPATGPTVRLHTTDDSLILGWAPRYLAHCVARSVSSGLGHFHARVVQLNQPPSPRSQRVLVELEGAFPAGHEPMNSEEFHSLHC